MINNKNAEFVYSRFYRQLTRFLFSGLILLGFLLPTSVYAVAPVNCSQVSDPITTFTLIPMDDLLIPVPVPYTLEGQCYRADFDGDGQLDILEVTSDYRYTLFLADDNGQYTSTSQSWQNGYLDQNWSLANAALYIDDYNGDGRADIMVVGNSNGDSSALVYAGTDGQLSQLGLAWDNDFVNQTLSADKFDTIGETAGSFDVSSNGSASYSIPIVVPPGIGGVQPSLSLNYNSQGGNGLAGVGWSLSGSSVIHRCPTNYDQDGYIDGVDFDGDDKFCMDGQRLVLRSGSYGGNNSVYHTEMETFSIITFKGTLNSGNGYFEVKTADGGTLYYGSTGDSQVEVQGRNEIMVWALAKSIDADGNYIEYHYYENHFEGENFLSHIEYGHTALGPVAGVDLLTAHGRDDEQRRYVAGSQVLTSRLLTSVRTYVGNYSVGKQYVREYLLNYEDSPDTRRKRISKVTECAYSSNILNSCKLSLTLNWRDDGAGTSGTQFNQATMIDTLHSETGWADDDHGLRHVMDFDNDGRTDILIGPDSGGEWRLMKGTDNGIVYQGIVAYNVKGNWSDNSSRIRPMDLNGDGYGDILLGPSSTGDWYWLENTGGTLVSHHMMPNFHYRNWYNESEDIHIGDYNGDGRDDVILGPSSDGNWYLLESNGTGFIDRWKIMTNAYSDWRNDGARVRAMDMNGDGRDDIVLGPDMNGCFFWLQSEVTPSNPSKFTNRGQTACDAGIPWANDSKNAESTFVVDFNGDGLQDIVFGAVELFGATSNSWRLLLNTGDGLVAKGEIYNGAICCDGSYRVHVIDVNADGNQDFVYGPVGESTGNWYWLMSNGQDKLENRGVILTDLGGFFNSQPRIYPIDVSGDGMQDIVAGPTSAGVWYTSKSINKNPDVLAGVTTGYGNTVDITYKPLTDASVHTPGTSNYPIRSLPAPIEVVVSYQVSNGIGGLNLTEYHYENMAVHLRGRGMLGFTYLKQTDHASLSVSETWFDRMTATESSSTDFWRNGMVTKSQQIANGKLISETTSDREDFTAVTSSYGGLIPHANGSVQLSWDPDTGNELSVVTTSYTDPMDGCGNLPTTVVTTEDRTTSKTYTETTSITFYQNLSDCSLHLPQARTVTTEVPNERQGQSGIETATLDTEYRYHPGTRRIHKEYRQPNMHGAADPAEVAEFMETTSEYDPIFHYQNFVQIDGHGLLESRVTQTSRNYHNVFTYTLTTTNALGHSETKTYDRRTGQVLNLIGPNGIINPSTQYNTVWQYDDFGRKVREIRVNDNQTNWGYHPCNSDCETGERYYLTQQVDGSPAVTTYFDQLGREVRSQTVGEKQNLLTDVVKRTEYDFLGRTAGTTNTHFVDGSGTAQESVYWSCTSYDVYGRVRQQSVPTVLTGTQQCRNSNPPFLVTYQYNNFTTTEFRKRVGQSATISLQTTQEKNVLGKLIKVTDALGNETRYAYNAIGKLVETIDPENNKISISYDNIGRKIAMSDPDMGDWSYEYNAMGELTRQTDAKGQSIIMEYDVLGRMDRRYLEGDVTGTETIWTFDTAQYGIGKLHSVANNADNYSRVYEYNDRGLVSGVDTHILYSGVEYTMEVDLDYDQFDRVATRTYPNTAPIGETERRFTVKNIYDSLGRLDQVQNAADNSVVWTAGERNARGGLTTQTLGNGVNVTREYHDQYGFVTGISSENSIGTTIQDSTYYYDSLGNLEQRQYILTAGTTNTLTETFQYDLLNRLTRADMSGPITDSITYTYSASGNIRTKSDFSDNASTNPDAYQYGATLRSDGSIARPHAVESVTKGGVTHRYTYDANGNVENRSIVGGISTQTYYTWFNKPSRIENLGENGIDPTFGYDDQHARMWQSTDQGLVLYLNPRRDLGGNFEKRFKSDGTVVYKHAIYGGGGVVAEHTIEEATGNEDTNYLLKDHLGSIEVITDASGAEKERFAYGPFGQRRFVYTGYTDNPSAPVLSQYTDHGFTGHEHLDNFGLIHMNGRIYDPMLGRFLSADPNVQFADSTQGYNRYAYVNNNPLSFTDPSGFFIFKKVRQTIRKHKREIIAGIFAYYTFGMVQNYVFWSQAATTAASVGAATISSYVAGGAAAGFVSGAIASKNMKGAATGAMVGGLTGGTNGWLSGSSVNSFSSFAMHVGASGTAGGISSKILGGSFEKGFKLAALATTVKLGIEKFTTQRPSYATAEQGHIIKVNPEEINYNQFPAHNPRFDICGANSSNCGHPFNHVGSINVDMTEPGIIQENSTFLGPLGKYVPGLNSGAILHDVFVGTVERSLGIWGSPTNIFERFGKIITNQGTIPLVIGINYIGLGAQSYAYYYNRAETNYGDD